MDRVPTAFLLDHVDHDLALDAEDRRWFHETLGRFAPEHSCEDGGEPDPSVAPRLH